ncbi:MAG: hypothetical protein AMXMBFR64_10170 [Myxococcales bacterium]
MDMVTHMKTTIDIADALFLEGKEVAARSGMTFRELVEQGLRLALQQRRQAEEFRLRDASVGGRGLKPGQSWDLPRELAYDDGRT